MIEEEVERLLTSHFGNKKRDWNNLNTFEEKFKYLLKPKNIEHLQRKRLYNSNVITARMSFANKSHIR